ncbi:phosphoribosylpyrophosphate synthetase, partial [Reticulomyxa filosa]
MASSCAFNTRVQATKPRMLDRLDEEFVVVSGRSNPTLAEQVSTALGKPLSKVEIGTYADGEVSLRTTEFFFLKGLCGKRNFGKISIRLGENVRGKDVYIIQGTCPPIHDNLLELVLLIASARRCSARRIIAVMPYYAYSRQDRTRYQRPGIAADDIATMLECVGADQVIAIDIHRIQLEGCFDESECQFDSLESLRAALPVLLEKDLFNPVIVCPSDTGIQRARRLQSLMLEEGGVWSSIAFVTTTKLDQTIEFAELESHEKIAAQRSEVVGA